MKNWLSELMLLFVNVLVMSVVGLNAQNTVLPYLNGFESAGDTAGWTFLQPSQYTGFSIGGAARCLDSGGLYISPDSGKTAQASSGGYVSIAYFPMTLMPGTHQMSFDYLLWEGDASSNFRVAAVPLSQNINTIYTGNYPQWASTYSVSVGTSKNQFETAGKWQHVVCTFGASVSSMRIVFLYKNATTSANSGLCIDNICITANETSLAPPTNIGFTYINDTVNITWDTVPNNSYEVVLMHYNGLSRNKSTPHFYTSGSPFALNDSLIDDGGYIVGVRPIFNGDTGHYGVSNVCLVNYRRSDYANLWGQGVVCTYGTYSNPHDTIGIIDYGQESEWSRHTVNNYVTYDNTVPNYLLTHPDDEAITVRLGNWDSHAKAESVSYLYQVPTTGNDVLLLKNAIVFEESGHAEPPAFIYEVLDTNGNKLDSLDFVDTKSYSVGWGYTTGRLYYITYRNWTTTGCDLTPFAGQTVRIRLTTKDCNWGAHCGYAYFAMRYDDAVLKARRYAPSDSITYSAPEGFFYNWCDTNVLGAAVQVASRAREFKVANNDGKSYYNICQSIEDTSHKLVLSTVNAMRLYPEAAISYSLSKENCRTRVSFANLSTRLGESVCGWSVRSAHEERVYHNSVSTDDVLGEIEVPAEGDTLTVAFRIENEVGYDVDTMIVYVPQYETDIVTIDTVIPCESQFCIEDSCFAQTGSYRVTVRSANGECDSVVYVINVVVVEDYLNFKAVNGSATIQLNDSSGRLTGVRLQYSVDSGRTWSNYGVGGSISLASGEKVYFKATDRNNTFSTSDSTCYQFSMTGSVECDGNIMSLLDSSLQLDTVPEYCFAGLFKGCTSLTQVYPVLPATTLAAHCYDNMFRGCSSLEQVPLLPATTLEDYCYRDMFNGCSSLSYIHVLPATELSDYCYESMFENCTNLKIDTLETVIPWVIRATTVGRGSLDNMFAGTSGTMNGTPFVDTIYYVTPKVEYVDTVSADADFYFLGKYGSVSVDAYHLVLYKIGGNDTVDIKFSNDTTSSMRRMPRVIEIVDSVTGTTTTVTISINHSADGYQVVSVQIENLAPNSSYVLLVSSLDAEDNVLETEGLILVTSTPSAVENVQEEEVFFPTEETDVYTIDGRYVGKYYLDLPPGIYLMRENGKWHKFGKRNF